MNFYDIIFTIIVIQFSFTLLVTLFRKKIKNYFIVNDFDIITNVQKSIAKSNWKRNDTFESFIDIFRFISHLIILCPHYYALYAGNDLTFTQLDFMLYFIALFGMTTLILLSGMTSGIWLSNSSDKFNEGSTKLLLKYYTKQLISTYIIYIYFTSIYYKHISLKFINKGDELVKLHCEKSIMTNIFLSTIWIDKTNMVD